MCKILFNFSTFEILLFKFIIGITYKSFLWAHFFFCFDYLVGDLGSIMVNVFKFEEFSNLATILQHFYHTFLWKSLFYKNVCLTCFVHYTLPIYFMQKCKNIVTVDCISAILLFMQNFNNITYTYISFNDSYSHKLTHELYFKMCSVNNMHYYYSR